MSDSPIDRYLQEFAREYSGGWRSRRRFVADIRDHLRQAAQAAQDEGVPRAEAERIAIRRFGDVMSTAGLLSPSSNISRAPLRVVVFALTVAAIATTAIVVAVSRDGAKSERLNATHSTDPSSALAAFVRGVPVQGVHVRSTVVRDRVRWVATTYVSDSHVCLEVDGYGRGLQAGGVSGCGQPAGGAFTWGIGGVQLGHHWYTVVYGQAPTTLADVELTLVNGVAARTATVVRGVWFAVYAADPTSPALDVRTIHAVDSSGHKIALIHPPPVSAYVRAARKLNATHPTLE